MSQEPPRLTPFQSLYLSLAVAGMSFTIGLSTPRASLLWVGSYFTGGVGLFTAAVLARRPMEKFEAEYSRLLAAWNEQVSLLESDYQQRSEAIESRYQQQITELKAAHADELGEAVEKIETHQANLFAAQRDQQSLISHAIEQGLAAARGEIDRLKSAQAEEIETLKKLAAQQLKGLQAERDRAIEANEQDFRVKLAEIRIQHNKAVKALQGKHEQEIEQLKATANVHVRQQLATAQQTINEQAEKIKGFVSLLNDHEQKFNELERKSNLSIMQLHHENQLLRANSAAVQTAAVTALTSPRKFSGSTSIDQVGNKIIDHFAEQQIILDALDSPKIPGGFCLRYRLDRNSPQVKLNQEIFDKEASSVGLWGLSYRPLEFKLDPASFLLSVNVYTATVEEVTAATSRAPLDIAARFTELGCFPAAEFETVIRSKFIGRVRVVAGSTGGKSPLMELLACALTKIYSGQLWLLSPVAGSEKDWFSVPGLVTPGVEVMPTCINRLEAAHKELLDRRNDTPSVPNRDFVMVCVDELPSIAREFPNLGTVLKDFYQFADHVRMGMITAAQGANVSGISGGSKSSAKTGNASKLMDEDFQNAVQVFTAQAAKKWIEKNLKGDERTDFEGRLKALNKLCAELNEAEGKSAYPSDISVKKVSPDAYRIALVLSPKQDDPFFIQLPPYGYYADKLDGITFPASAKITAPIANQEEMGLIAPIETGKPQNFECPHCGHDACRRKGFYESGLPRWVCSKCQRVPNEDED